LDEEEKTGCCGCLLTAEECLRNHLDRRARRERGFGGCELESAVAGTPPFKFLNSLFTSPLEVTASSATLVGNFVVPANKTFGRSGGLKICLWRPVGALEKVKGWKVNLILE